MVSIVLFLSLFVFLVLNLPVAIAIGMATLMAIIAGGNLSSLYLSQNLTAAVNSFPLLAVPLFVLAGELMSSGGISKRLLNVANVFLGRITGSLAMVTVAICMFFAAISGSAPATVAAVGSMVVPTMLEKGYSKKFTLGLLACAGSIGVIIPPSIPMVIYGINTGTSIAGMFMAGFLPGILIGLALMAWSYFYCKKKGWKGDDEKFTFKRAVTAVWDAKWALINPVIILGGIYGGIFTPTEAASVAAVYAFVCGVFIYREQKLSEIFKTIGSACLTTGTTMVIVGCATLFTLILTMEEIPTMVTQAIISITDNKILILLMINLLLLIVGCFMDTISAILVLGPILLPVALLVGLNPIHFGIIMVVNLAIGFVTPPLGFNLFVAARVGEEPVETVTSGIVPFFIVMIICLLVLTFIPGISMVLPNLLL
jgi:C4-dicarboxylate transporter DctM subunit